MLVCGWEGRGIDRYMHLILRLNIFLTLYQLMTTRVFIQIWVHVISWHNRFEDRFCDSRKGGIRGGCMAALGAWLVPYEPFFYFLAQTSIEMGHHFWDCQAHELAKRI